MLGSSFSAAFFLATVVLVVVPVVVVVVDVMAVNFGRWTDSLKQIATTFQRGPFLRFRKAVSR